MELDTTRLRSFLHVAELGTVTAAAEALGFTGPAVSQHISKLEAQFGVALFERTGGRLALSVHGDQLVPVALEMIDLTDVAHALVAATQINRLVRLAGFASAIRTVVLPAMEQFADIDWDVRELEDDEALRALRLGTIDIAVIQEYTNRPERRDRRLGYTNLAQDTLRLVAPPGSKRNVNLAEMAASAWLVNGTGTRCEAAANLILTAAGITPRVVGRVGDTATLFALVAAGHGATIAPDRMLADATTGVVVSTVDLGVTRQILAVQRESVRSTNDDVIEALVAQARRSRNGSSRRQ
jgi:DNA-binding transcriptional LysR family regulator